EDGASQRRLARPGLAEQAERLAAGEIEADAADGADQAAAAPGRPALRAEGHVEVAELEQRRHRGMRSQCRQAVAQEEISASWLSPKRQASSASGQRGWKRQPAGRSAGAGGSPGSSGSRPPLGLESGRARSNPSL